MAKKNSITVRHPKFSYEKLSKPENAHYIAGNSLATHFLNAMHVIVPVGERFFIRSVKAFTAELKNPELKKRVKAFIGQEMVHEKEHTKFWKVMEIHNLDVAAFENFFSSTAFDIMEPLLNRILGSKFSLAMTAALEHMTAFGASNALDTENSLLDKIEPEMAKMLRWHAVEEIEHKSVAFDVLKEVDDSYLLRISAFIFAVTLFQMYGFVGMIMFSLQDPKVTIPKFFEDLEGFLSLNRRRMSPKWFKEMFSYFRPDFHPDDTDHSSLIAPYVGQFENSVA